MGACIATTWRKIGMGRQQISAPSKTSPQVLQVQRDLFIEPDLREVFNLSILAYNALLPLTENTAHPSRKGIPSAVRTKPL